MTIQRSKFSSRLSPADVEAIRAAHLPTRNADLARKYGVTATTIARIRRGETWRVDAPEVLRVPVRAEVLSALEEAATKGGTPAPAVAGRVLDRWAARQRAK